MQAISLHQPFATLFAAGLKCCETRAWPLRHRGPLLIHAAKRWDADLAMIAVSDPFRRALESVGVVFTANETDAKRGWNLPFGAIVGRVDVIDSIPTERVGMLMPVQELMSPQRRREFTQPQPLLLISETEKAFGDFGPNRWAWLCANAVRFAEPVPFRGMQGLFDVPDDLIPEEYRCTQ